MGERAAGRPGVAIQLPSSGAEIQKRPIKTTCAGFVLHDNSGAFEKHPGTDSVEVEPLICIPVASPEPAQAQSLFQPHPTPFLLMPLLWLPPELMLLSHLSVVGSAPDHCGSSQAIGLKTTPPWASGVLFVRRPMRNA